MLIRTIFAFIAKEVYSKEYCSLKNGILFNYRKIETNDSKLNTQVIEQLLISGEDHRYKFHIGFDTIAIFRAVIKNIFYQKKEGASTIEQQLVRVISNDYTRSLRRKIKEIFLATTVAEIIPSSKVPLLYLHVAYYGPNTIGLPKILEKLQISDVQLISVSNAAEVVARIKYPDYSLVSTNRQKQIEQRKNHLLKLYTKHKKKKLFNPYYQITTLNQFTFS